METNDILAKLWAAVEQRQELERQQAEVESRIIDLATRLGTHPDRALLVSSTTKTTHAAPPKRRVRRSTAPPSIGPERHQLLLARWRAGDSVRQAASHANVSVGTAQKYFTRFKETHGDRSRSGIG